MTRFGGRSSGAPVAESTPASRSVSPVDVDMQLVARRAVERAAPVGADLGADAELAQQRERAAGGRRAREIEVHGELPSRRCQVPAAWKSADSSASVQQRRGRDRGELVAQLVRERQSFLEREQPALVVDAEVAVRADAASRDDPVHGHERRQVAAGAERPGRARGARASGERGELAVGDDLAARHGPERRAQSP